MKNLIKHQSLFVLLIILSICTSAFENNSNTLKPGRQKLSNLNINCFKQDIIENQNQNSNIITILFAYTTTAAIAAGGPNVIKRKVDEGVVLLNQALKNNNVPCTVKAIEEYVEVEYGAASNENEVGSLLSELGKVDGKFNKVHEFRRQKQADIVCLVFSGFAMGKANLGGDMMVCHYDAFGESYVFQHEFGHNMGATHEAGMTFNFGDNGTTYRTISGNGGVSIPYFSENRSITIDIAGQSRTFNIGDATHDNAKTIKNNVPAKSKLGENLPNFVSSSKAVAAKLVNPMTASIPNGSPSYTINSFSVESSGKITIKYKCTDAVNFTISLYDSKGNSYGGFGRKIDPSLTEWSYTYWTETYKGDKFVLKIDDKEIKSYIIP